MISSLRHDGTADIVKDEAQLEKVRAAMPEIMALYEKNGWEMGMFYLENVHAEIRGMLNLMAEEKNSTIEERFGKCPYATVQSLISGRCAVLILHYLENGPVRFDELRRQMPKMSHAALSVQLKTLAEEGLVSRTADQQGPRKAEYALTEIGEEFRPVLDSISEWGSEYIASMEKQR
ncbi:MAG: winged helix-turn-helix transcriptional regulator [Bulleidia sp.]